ncbi:MAG: DUF72 domain-containing protein [Lentisphaerae bacterium]|nr:DUF72 domain-containing protein [Lentisphaerota bacterium]
MEKAISTAGAGPTLSRKEGAIFRIGTSGWNYRHWRERFYPADLPARRWFEHYAEVFDTVEINNTFYRLPEEATFDHWRQQAPPGFLYAVKASRYLTHDLLERHPRRVTGRCVYVRFHGAGQLYGGSYTTAELRHWAEWLRQAAAPGRPAYTYFNNDAEAHAVRNGVSLRQLLSL